MRLTVGVDIVDVREIEASITRFGTAYLERVYTSRELAYARSGDMSHRLGARFAAKEAMLKALDATHVGINWRSIEVVCGANGEPSFTLSGSACEAAIDCGLTTFALSLTHQGNLATAVVIATRDAPPSRLSWRKRG
jgi:holo-[acyl-carrier protein] synthase